MIPNCNTCFYFIMRCSGLQISPIPLSRLTSPFRSPSTDIWRLTVNQLRLLFCLMRFVKGNGEQTSVYVDTWTQSTLVSSVHGLTNTPIVEKSPLARLFHKSLQIELIERAKASFYLAMSNERPSDFARLGAMSSLCPQRKMMR